MMMADWWTVLQHYPRESVEHAFAEWHRDMKRMPNIAEIRELCVAAPATKAVVEARRLALPPPEPAKELPPPERRAEMAAEVDMWLRRVGASTTAPLHPSAQRAEAPSYADPTSPAYAAAKAALQPKGETP